LSYDELIKFDLHMIPRVR